MRTLTNPTAVKRKLAAGVEVRWGETSPPHNGVMKMTLDKDNMAMFAKYTEGTKGQIDSAGVTVFGHEVNHGEAGLFGGIEAMRLGDVPSSAEGTAMQEGQRIYGETPTLDEKSAAEIVDAALEDSCPDAKKELQR